jgi:hypothetical protein
MRETRKLTLKSPVKTDLQRTATRIAQTDLGSIDALERADSIAAPEHPITDLREGPPGRKPRIFHNAKNTVSINKTVKVYFESLLKGAGITGTTFVSKSHC